MARPRKGEEKHAEIMLTVRIPLWVHDGLRSLAKEADGPVSEVANEALVTYLKRKGIKRYSASRS
jgi:hypothetical protein